MGQCNEDAFGGVFNGDWGRVFLTTVDRSRSGSVFAGIDRIDFQTMIPETPTKASAANFTTKFTVGLVMAWILPANDLRAASPIGRIRRRRRSSPVLCKPSRASAKGRRLDPCFDSEPAE